MTVRRIKQKAQFKGKAVLEIGCGQGKISSLLAGKTKQYIGIDPDEKAIERAERDFPDMDFMVGNGESLAFGDSIFDLVLFTLSLHHLNSAVGLKEAYRILKDEGKLIVVEPSETGDFQQLFHLFNDETTAIQDARHSMADSDFVLEDKGSFNAIVRFKDAADLCQYDFDRERAASGDEERIMNKLAQLQPGASERSPIILKDTLDIYLMYKP